MSIIYTNTVPIALVYPNFNHFFLIFDMNPKRIYVNFWDNYAFEHFISDKLYGSNKFKEISKNIFIFEKIISSSSIPFNSITYSEASKRLLKDKEYYNLFLEILANISMKNLEEVFGVKELIYSEMTLSNFLNIIIDYLIATFFDKLYPELNLEKPDIYFTSERFKLFYPVIEKILKKEDASLKLPKPVYTPTFPFIRCPKTKIIPSLNSSLDEIQNILTNYFEKEEMNSAFLNEIVEILAKKIDKFKFKNEMLEKESFLRKLKISDKQIITELLSYNFIEYFLQIEKSIKENKNVKNKILLHQDKSNMKIKHLNENKIKILRLCNGNNTSLNIAKALNMNLSTVSAYLGQLKNMNLATNERKPNRRYDQILIDLKE